MLLSHLSSRSIRRMPRAASQVEVMLEQIEAVKQNIVGLSNTLKQQPQVVTEAPPLRAQADDEERKVQRLQARIAELKKRVCLTVVLPIE